MIRVDWAGTPGRAPLVLSIIPKDAVKVSSAASLSRGPSQPTLNGREIKPQ